MAAQKMLKKEFYDTSEDNDYKKLGAWFLGSKGENHAELQNLLDLSLSWHAKWRRDYFPQDPPYITPDLKQSKEYKEQLNIIERELHKISTKLQNSIPFFSSRYKGHMNWDVSMVGILAYFATMLYNPNNVAAEGSPVTTAIEHEVGKQLCNMLGYQKTDTLKPWGHITSCGTVANIESLWAARNVKYLTTAIFRALKDGSFSKSQDIGVTLANGQVKKVMELTEWELLNIPTDEALNLLAKLNATYPPGEVLTALAKFDVQNQGMQNTKQGRYIVPISRHYSWEKAGAVLGIGQANMLKIQIDQHGRIDMTDLKRTIEECVRDQIPIIQLVVIVGSTAEGCVDPVTSILELRNQFRQQHNVDFHIHVDAAWGGYFCTMLKRQREMTGAFVSGMVPYLPLSRYVEQQLMAIGSCDSCTVDPHKSGFIQYPAGALCYRNGSIRYLLTFQSPVIGSEGPDVSIGIFGIEGSKAGAAVVATYLHHKVVGLGPRGHGRLLAQAHFTTKKIYALLATMASDDDPFKIALYTRSTASPALLQKFVKSTNEDVLADPTLMEEARNIGPDLHINAFCVNFSWPILSKHRTKNTSLELANKLIQTISDELNITEAGSMDDTTTPTGAARKRLFLIRNELGDQHKAVTSQLKQDLGIDPNAPGPMRYLVNTNMDPWPTATGFMDVFESELRQSILRAIGSVKEDPHNHGFVVTDDATSTVELYGNHLPVFSEPQHNYHLVLKLQFQSANDKLAIFKQYQDQLTRQVQQKNKPLILGNQNISTLHNLIYNKEFWTADVFCGFPSSANPPFTQVMLRVSDVLINEHFDPRSVYPKKEEYFIYGSQKRMYMSHCMAQYPDFHQVVELAIAEPPIDPLLLELGFKVTLGDVDGGFKPQDPFKYDATTYTISYPFQGSIVSNIIRPLRPVWFDAEQINVQHVHERHEAHEAAFATTSRIGTEGGVPARKEISTIVFDVLETLGTIQTKPDRTDFFRPHKRIHSILRQLRQQKKNLALILNNGIEKETVNELAPFFTSIGKSLDEVLKQFSNQNCLVVSENAHLRRQAEAAGHSTLAYAHLVLHELKGEPLKLFKVLLPLNYKPDLVRDMLILHQYPMEWDGTTFLQTVAVMPQSKIKILHSQRWKVEPLDVKHPSRTELTASWISKENIQIKEDTTNALKEGHGDQIRLVSRIQPVLESKLEGVLNAKFTEGDSWYLSLPQKQEFEEVMNSFKITPYNNRHVLSGIMNDTTLALGKLLEKFSQTTFQKFVLDSTQIHDVDQTDSDILLNNVIGEITGSSDEVVIISAHLDSTASFSYPQGYHPTEDLAPGQDDDGSGVAAVLLASKFFAERYKTKPPRRTIRFVLFNAEEHGLVGSQKYARMARDYGDNVVAVFHMDMIGFNMRTKRFEVHVGLSSSPLTSLPKIEKRSIPLFHLINASWQELERAQQTTLERPELYTSRRGDPAARRSDHFSFHQLGYPACVVSEDFFPAGELRGEPNPNYHTSNDNTVDPTYAVDVARVVIGAALLAVDS